MAANPAQSKRAYRKKLETYMRRARPKIRKYFQKVKLQHQKEIKKAIKFAAKLKGDALVLYKQLMKISQNEKISLKTEKARFAQILHHAAPSALRELFKQKAKIPGVKLPSEKQIEEMEKQKGGGAGPNVDDEECDS